jgi:hypothetical protein
MTGNPPITDLSGPELVKRGVVLDVCAADYHSAPGVSKSGLDRLAQSPAHYRAWLIEERKETPALRFGRIAHRYTLEPDQCALVIAPDCPKQSKEDKTRHKAAQDEADALGAYLVSADEAEALRRMRESVYLHPIARKIVMARGPVECCAWWYDQHSGELCRCRPDKAVMPPNGGAILADLKTTEDASPDPFARAVAKYRYQVQAAFYSDGWAAATGQHVDSFLFVALEKSAPFACAVYELDAAALEYGRMLYQRDLMTLAQCKIERRWPAYSDHIKTLSLPRWAMKEMENGE